MTLARNLVQGVDIWLNNPRRPLEASGTSGQKVSINGIINFSILDGWWCEGYNGKNGWTIGDDTVFENEYNQDNFDSDSIYDILEKEIIPIYFDRNENGVPVKWVKIMKESIKSLTAIYSMHRMVQEYTTKFYIPSMKKVDQIIESNYNYLKVLSDWKNNIERNWPQVQIISDKIMNQLKQHNLLSGESALDGTTIGTSTDSEGLFEIYSKNKFICNNCCHKYRVHTAQYRWRAQSSRKSFSSAK